MNSKKSKDRKRCREPLTTGECEHDLFEFFLERRRAFIIKGGDDRYAGVGATNLIEYSRRQEAREREREREREIK